MKPKLNAYGQTQSWEQACIKTRRDDMSRRKRISKFNFHSKDVILDLGCGDGLNIPIIQEFSPKKVIGLDISKDLLKIAKKNNPNVSFYLGTGEHLPFKTGTFTVVFVDSVFHHLMRYDLILKEIHRVLKKNGKLCFIEPHNHWIRKAMDIVSVTPIAQYLPIIRERSVSYMGEITLMKHWLTTEDLFYTELQNQKFIEQMKEPDFLSIIGQYKKV